MNRARKGTMIDEVELHQIQAATGIAKMTILKRLVGLRIQPAKAVEIDRALAAIRAEKLSPPKQ